MPQFKTKSTAACYPGADGISKTPDMTPNLVTVTLTLGRSVYYDTVYPFMNFACIAEPWGKFQKAISDLSPKNKTAL